MFGAHIQNEVQITIFLSSRKSCLEPSFRTDRLYVERNTLTSSLGASNV